MVKQKWADINNRIHLYPFFDIKTRRCWQNSFRNHVRPNSQCYGMMKLAPLRFVHPLPSTASDDIFHPAQTRPVIAMKVCGYRVIYVQIFKNLHKLLFIRRMTFLDVRRNPWGDVHEDKSIAICG